VTDPTTAEIARRCRQLSDVTPDDVAQHAATVRLIDTLGCAAGGLTSPPAALVAQIASAQCVGPGGPGARLLGDGRRVTVEMAAFANGVMARYLDYNDTYTGAATGHPSDMIPALLAVAESTGASGAQLLVAIVAGYEAFGAVGKTVRIRARGWDQGVLVGLGAAAGSAILLGLDQARFEHAIGLAATMAMPTRATRAGALSMWKGCATAASARFGVFAAQLAAVGMTAPDRAIEGKDGLWQQVTGEFALRPFGGEEPWVVSMTAIKQFPLEFNAQSAVELIADVRKRIDPSEVASIRVDTYWSAYDEIGNEPEKWAPESRETADHSLPYLLAVALRDGQVTSDSFGDADLRDPWLRAAMATVTVAEDPAFTARWPEAVPCRITVRTHGGESVVAEADYPHGHPRRPLSDSAIAAKFLSLAASALGEDRARAALERLYAAHKLADVGEILDLFAVAGAGATDPPLEVAHG
jgi:2-methylcitrate dehydratase